MRWTKEKQSVVTNFRAIKRFAFFPIKCKNEYRWLEMCYIFQSEWSLWYETGWTNEFWMTKEEYEIWNKGCKYAQFETECPHRVGDGCKLRYNAYKDDCGDCFRKVGFNGSKEYNSKM